MTNKELRKINDERLRKALRCEETDRTPTPLSMGGVAMARYADPAIVPGDFYTRPQYAMDKQIEGMIKYDSDSTTMPAITLGMNRGDCPVRWAIPGRDIPMENEREAMEYNKMTAEDYDFVIENGFKAFLDKVTPTIFTEQDAADGEASMPLYGYWFGKMADSQFSPFLDSLQLNWGAGFNLSLHRGFSNLLKDLRKAPEKVKAVLKIINDYEISNYEAAIEKGQKPTFVMLPLGRNDNNSVSHKAFEEFFFPEIAAWNAKVTENGSHLMIHADGNYTNDMDLFAELTPKNTLMQLDGFTDALAIADEMVAHKLCFWGDVPPHMMSLGDPDEVFEYCMKLKRAYGPGIMLAPGCCFPMNSKLENIDAVKRAANTAV